MTNDLYSRDALIPFQLYEIETGELLPALHRASSLAEVELQCDDGISYVFGHHDLTKCRVVGGEVVPKNPS